MRRATGISLSLHGIALAALVAAAVSAPPPPMAPARPIAVALAPVPARKPPPAPPALKPPEPQPVPKPPQPQAQPRPKRPPPPVKPAARPIPTPAAPVLAAPVLAAPVLAAEAAEPTPANPAPAAPPAPPAPSAPSAAHSAGPPDVSWLGAVRARLEAVKRYPSAAARRGEQGVATIRLEIAPDGRILSVSLSASSGSRLLDREAQDLPERLYSLPPMPESMGRAPITLVVPISFALR